MSASHSTNDAITIPGAPVANGKQVQIDDSSPLLAMNDNQPPKPLPTQQQSRRPKRSFYRRPLPDACTAFSSRKGRRLFQRASQSGGLKSFFHVMEQHTTQSEPAYCGMATLVVALNAFGVDPRQAWKEQQQQQHDQQSPPMIVPWRWYHEEMLACCVDLEQVKRTGITIQDFRCLALCQGLEANVYYVDEAPNNSNSTVEEVPSSSSTSPPPSSLEHFRSLIVKACVQEPGNENESLEDNDNDDDDVGLGHVLAVSYHRGTLGQTGTGHFAPVAAYNPQDDQVLLLDTARFKYGAHWVPVPLLYQAMEPIDPATIQDDDNNNKDNNGGGGGRSRGYILLSNLHNDSVFLDPVSNLVRFRLTEKSKRARSQFRNAWDCSTKDIAGAMSWPEMVRYWTKSGRHPNYIWDMIEPQLKPCEQDEIQLVDQVISVINQLLSQEEAKEEGEVAIQKSDSSSSFHTDDEQGCLYGCRPNHGRSLPLRPMEAIFILYLAMMDPTKRDMLTLQDDKAIADHSDDEDKEIVAAARQHLLVTAERLRLFVEVSDEQ